MPKDERRQPGQLLDGKTPSADSPSAQLKFIFLNDWPILLEFYRLGLFRGKSFLLLRGLKSSNDGTVDSIKLKRHRANMLVPRHLSKRALNCVDCGSTKS